MLDDVKTVLRITNNAYDAEIKDLIEAAKMDLKLSGVNIDKTVTETYTPEPTEENPFKYISCPGLTNVKSEI